MEEEKRGAAPVPPTYVIDIYNDVEKNAQKSSFFRETKITSKKYIFENIF